MVNLICLFLYLFNIFFFFLFRNKDDQLNLMDVRTLVAITSQYRDISNIRIYNLGLAIKKAVLPDPT